MITFMHTWDECENPRVKHAWEVEGALSLHLHRGDTNDL